MGVRSRSIFSGDAEVFVALARNFEIECAVASLGGDFDGDISLIGLLFDIGDCAGGYLVDIDDDDITSVLSFGPA